MRQADQLILLLAFGLCLFSLRADDCIYQECECYGTTIICSDKHFTSLPPSLGTEQSNFTTLILDNNQIITIPAQSLPANLTQISLEENPVTTVDEAAFDTSAFTLTILAFSDALFTKIPDAFLHLHALSQLILEDTNITDWNLNAMMNIGQTLEMFYLSQKSLALWPDYILHFTHLTVLSITGTSIATIPDNAFDNIANSLTSLALFNNMLNAIPKSLSKLTVLQSLYLNANKIVDIEWLPIASNLRSLALDYNRITDANQLSKILKRYAESLDDFGITCNRLTVIPDFSFFQNIEQFYFTGNRINDPYSGSLPVNISVLSFANNSLPSIPSIVLKLKYVTELLVTQNIIHEIRGTEIPQWINMIEIDYNFITEITETSFPEKSSLAYLNINYNPVSRITDSAFKNVQLLNELTIKGSQLTRVPLAFGSLVNIHFLDVSDSRSLVCTCLEKGLNSWIQRLSSFSINGNCGDISIYFFFVTLGPFCPTN